MPKIYSQLDKPEHRFSEAGKRFLNTYQMEVKNGVKTLIKNGETNIYEKIQANLESTKIENILHAVAMGDLNALQQRETTYADATTMPKNLMEAQNLVIRLKDEFGKLPLEVRKEFNNSAEMYVEQMGTKEFNDKMAPYNKRIAEIAEAGSLKEYNKKVAEQAKFENDVAAAKGAKTE